MPFGNRISRLLVLALTTAAIAAPAASAMPINPVHHGGSTPAQDLRTEAARSSSDFVARPDAPATPKAVVTLGDDDGVDGPLVGLLIAGVLAAGCAMAAIALARGPRIAH